MVDRTKKIILRAFNTLIKKYDMEKITVEMLIKEAEISKATFYRYFSDKYDVMNYNYTTLLDSLSAPERSCSYRNLYEQLYRYGKLNWKFLQKAFATTGDNSFCEYIENYSKDLIKKITLLNRGSKGLTPSEELQCDVFCKGIPYMYEKWIFEKYDLSPEAAAKALYDMMPVDLRDLWYIED